MPVSASATSTAAEWRSGWPVVLASFVGHSFLSIMIGSLSIFMEPISHEFGWERTLVAAGFAVSSALSALLSPVFGAAVDRYGARRLALPGVVATTLAICLFATATGSAWQWYLLWGVYATISIAVKPVIWTSAVAGAFDRGRGMALGIVNCGTAASAAILPPLTVWLIDVSGWRAAYLWLGLGWGGITFVVSWFFLVEPRDRKRGERQRAGKREVPAAIELSGLTIAEAWRYVPLWQISVSTFLFMMVTVGFSIHQFAILGGAGVSRQDSALLASMAGIAALAGKLITGALLDRFRANWVCGLTISVAVFGFAFLLEDVSSLAIIVFAMLVNGYTQGAKVQMASYLTVQYIGMRHFGAIYGTLNSVIAVASGIGPVLAGYIFDTQGNYTVFLVASAAASLISGLLLVTLPAPLRFPAPARGEGGEPAKTEETRVAIS